LGTDLARASEKVMFEVYREGGYDRRFRVVYFTELNDHNKDIELNRCLSGETFLSGFIAEHDKRDAKRIIAEALRRLNDGEDLTPDGLRGELGEHMV
jgi:hypothetical protein